MSAKVTFNELEKIILISATPVNGEIYIDVKEDLYSSGKKDWVINENLRKFIFPIVSVGGNELPGSKALGATFFLASNWKIRPYEANHKLIINGNLYSDDGSDPFLNTIGTYTVRIIQQVSSLVDSTVQQLSEIEYASFNNSVTIDMKNGVEGTDYNCGTLENPVNNMRDVLAIADKRGFEKIHVHGDLTLKEGDNVENFEFIGHGSFRTNIIIEPEALTLGCTFKKVNISGTLDGKSIIENCKVGDLDYVNGEIRSSRLVGPILLGGGANALIADCTADIPAVPTIIDMGGAGQDLFVSDWSGAIKFINMTGVTNKIGLQMDGGRVFIDSSVSAGFVGVVGIGEMFDSSTGTTEINIDGLLSKSMISSAVWDENIANHLIEGTTGNSVGVSQFNDFITIDVSGVAGTAFPIGTKGTPVNNIPDAVLIATSMGINRFYFVSDFTFDNTIMIANYELHGQGKNKTTLTFEWGCVVDHCSTHNAKVTGLSSGITELYNCLVSNYGGADLIPGDITVTLEDCIVDGNINIPSNYSGVLKVMGCYTGGTAADSSFITVDANGANFTMILKGHFGAIKVINNTHASSYYSMDYGSGRLELDSTVTAGTFVVRGDVLITNNSTGTSINMDGALSKAVIADSVWNVELKNFQNDDTPGFALTQTSYNNTIFIDPVGGHDGTAYPKGIRNTPVKTMTSALGLADTYDCNRIHVIGALTLNNEEDVGGLTFTSDRSIGNSVAITNADTEKTYFDNLTVSGTMNGTIRFTYCVLGALTGFTGGAKNSMLTSSIVLGTANNYLTDVDSYVTSTTDFRRITVGIYNLNMFHCQGNYEIYSKTGSNTISLNMVGGIVKIDATCTAGTIIVNGHGTLEDNSAAGCTVVSTGLL